MLCQLNHMFAKRSDRVIIDSVSMKKNISDLSFFFLYLTLTLDDMLYGFNVFSME